MVALADGTACDDGDPCTHGERCSAGSCTVRATEALTTAAGSDLEATDFVLRRSSKRIWKLTAEGAFGSTTPIDPIHSALTFGILEADGTLLYEAQLPAGAFIWRRGRFLYRASDSAEPYGLQRVELRPSNGEMAVNLTAKVPPAVAVAPGMEELRRRRGRSVATSSTGRKLTWMISMGDRCVRDRTVSCPTVRSSSKRCR
jgi:hypothetical protein